MAEHNETGKAGEELAVQYLLEHGYEILHRNWRHGRYEIDIIARKKSILSIVEVKSRTGDFFGEPEEGVTRRKEKYLAEAADFYLQSVKLDLECRFDIVSVTFFNGRHELKFIEDAFYPFM